MNFMKAFDMQRYDFLKVDENCGEGGERVRFQEIAGCSYSIIPCLLF